MFFLRIGASTPEVVVLLLLALVLVFVVQFVLVSRRRLRAMIEESKRQASLTGQYCFDEPLKPEWPPRKQVFTANIAPAYTAEKRSKSDAPGVEELKRTMRQQQKLVDQLLTRMDKLDAQEGKGLAQTAATALALEERESELQKTKQQLSAAQQVAGHVTQTYRELDLMQQRMAELEEAASRANVLALEVEDLEKAYMQARKEAARHQEQLRDMTTERQQLHQQLAETVGRLTETDRSHQQLQKRVQLLEDLNAELQHMSDANHKLKSELRRIAELESMLSLVSDERDLLLKKRVS